MLSLLFAFIYRDDSLEATSLLYSLLCHSSVTHYNSLALVDISKAFDSVSHDTTVRSTEVFGELPPLVRYISQSYENAVAAFPNSKVHCGRQGDPLSALLFNMAMDEAASPALTELEIVMLDWVGKLLKLPKQFLHEGNQGGGVIQCSASDCVLLSMLAARHKAIIQYRHLFASEPNPGTAVLGRLVAYASTLAHSCVEKAGMICFVYFRQIKPDSDFAMQGSALQEAIERRTWNPVESLVCDVLRQLNVLHQAASCFSHYDI
ncbi:hypothetical protein T265_10507 [Opisthorchis viverrini]|uniref:Uncharacterized protein n=1 Tax=Opisthorchis viverrini TaxID=6198 RepID=A0A074Z272_OPIVI|nr:hypothetical protein T265_10507 [Opisthorchis viverrini]KER21093.1 hypothetical protein T265_10507 [Opisthorchis viverrini]